MKIAVYGSLRKDAYNYERFKFFFGDDYEYERTATIRGYKLYDLGIGYPCAVVDNEHNSELTVDIVKVSEKCLSTVTSMEISAGYKPSIIDVDGEQVIIYLFKSPEGTLVKSGDWIKHLNKQK